ncbi:hypothetical protein DENSPDRAFT_845631 [Dentipellis sp. KUC8613]|nr:hypothetical protein DENSPDRAFT_845631 [Dentipellis sp. KUC8613]
MCPEIKPTAKPISTTILTLLHSLPAILHPEPLSGTVGAPEVPAALRALHECRIKVALIEPTSPHAGHHPHPCTSRNKTVMQ